jgi:hypothetical protein
VNEQSRRDRIFVEPHAAQFGLARELVENRREQPSRKRRRPEVAHVPAEDRIELAEQFVPAPVNGHRLIVERLPNLTAEF